ncbi:MAG TPA: hypothetical protein PLB73_07365, partial [Leptospiraceae bacterium]|nr:hypothetical protein [Leptospiraceae bacterium]
MPSLLDSIQSGAYADARAQARELVSSDPRALSQSAVKKWAGMRFRNLFISHATSDPAAVSAA